MRASGVIRFEAVSRVGLQLLRDFEGRKPKGVILTFDSPHDYVLMHWDASADLTEVTRLIQIVS